MVNDNFRWFQRRGLIKRTPFASRSCPGYVQKARTNLSTMRILWKINESETARTELSVPDGYDPSDWVVITAYYSMYMMALALLSRVNWVSANHRATVVALETLFVKKRLLEPAFVKMLNRAHLEKDYVERLAEAKTAREEAQYGLEKTVSRVVAEHQMRDAYAFIKRLEELLDLLDGSSIKDRRR
jgi:uncharacterized protein (UPF0332 family)